MAYPYPQSAYHTNPAYYGTQPGPPEKVRPEVAVPMNQMPAPQMTQAPPKWSWCSSGWSIFATICCASPCGFLALLFSVWSYVDHKSGDYERSNFKRRWSWGCAIFAITLGLLILVAFLLIVFVFYDDICDEMTAEEREDNEWLCDPDWDD